jgi:hypothetical protein
MLMKAKPDGNQKQIVKELREHGDISVYICHREKNFVDIIIGYEGSNFLYEIKANSKKKLTSGESKFQSGWFGHVKTVTTSDEILTDIKYKK